MLRESKFSLLQNILTCRLNVLLTRLIIVHKSPNNKRGVIKMQFVQIVVRKFFSIVSWFSPTSCNARLVFNSYTCNSPYYVRPLP